MIITFNLAFLFISFFFFFFSCQFAKMCKVQSCCFFPFLPRGNKNVTLTLSWNVIPNAGTLPKVRGVGHHRLVFPDSYTAGRF